MSEKLFSLNEVQDRYKEEDIELSAEINAVVNISICQGHDDEGNLSGKNGVQINIIIDDEYVAHGFLENDISDKGWTLDTLKDAFQIDPKARIWDVVDPN